MFPLTPGFRFLFRLVPALAVPGPVIAHTAEDQAPQNAWAAWTFEPWVFFVTTAAALIYVVGLRRVWRRTKLGRRLLAWQALAYASGLLMLVIVLVSPLDTLAGALFSVHMVQHLVLMLLAAPLLAFSQPVPVLVWALPASWRRGLAGRWRSAGLSSIWHAISNPLVIWVLNVVVLWAWHVPALYQAALGSEAVHRLQHTSFLIAALLFWWAVADFARRGLRHGAAIMYIFTTMMHGMALGVIIATSRVLLYPAYSNQRAFGLTPLEDQQLAGLIMWMPPGLVYLAATAALFFSWLKHADQRARIFHQQAETHADTSDTS